MRALVCACVRRLIRFFFLLLNWISRKKEIHNTLERKSSTMQRSAKWFIISHSANSIQVTWTTIYKYIYRILPFYKWQIFITLCHAFRVIDSIRFDSILFLFNWKFHFTWFRFKVMITDNDKTIEYTNMFKFNIKIGKNKINIRSISKQMFEWEISILFDVIYRKFAG